ncbi:MAG: biotin/lipoyl-binding carrier protein [Burkholderiaceae bacterium]
MTQHVHSDVSGQVREILVRPGDAVSAGDALVIIESMKMEIPVEADASGVVGSIEVMVGDAVTEGQRIAAIEAAA